MTHKIAIWILAKYEGLGRLPEVFRRILDIVHRDFNRALSKTDYGRGDYTSKLILPSIYLCRGESYCDVVYCKEKKSDFFAELHQAWTHGDL